MPPKIRDLIAVLEQEGFKNRGGKAVIVILFTQMLSNLLQFQIKLVMMRNITKYEQFDLP
jgi:hypothetical protein